MRPINKQDYEEYVDEMNHNSVSLISSHNLENLENYHLDNEPIDEEKLDKLAQEDTSKIISAICFKTGISSYDYTNLNSDVWENIVIEAYKAGYRKAKEK